MKHSQWLSISTLTLWLTIPAWGAEQPPEYGAPRLLGHLENRQIDESSGLARSNLHPGLFWTHNDSGDKARLFAFNSVGEHKGTCRLRGVKPDDWEDMGSFVFGEAANLFVADVGDNGLRRSEYVIHIAPEPSSPKRDTQVTETLVFTYEDDQSHDSEAVGLDVNRREFLLFEKQRVGLRRHAKSVSNVWLLKWQPGRRNQRAVASKIATIDVPPIVFELANDTFSLPITNAITGLDISPQGRRAVISTYGECIVFQRSSQQAWSDVFQSPGRSVTVPIPPVRIQGESICFGGDGATLYLTSEKRPCPLFVVPVKGTK